MESKERKALERIKGLVRTQVICDEGDDSTPPSFLDIYNAAIEGLRRPTDVFSAIPEPRPENLPTKLN